ncbi:MAG: PEP-CTERM sorting domain-containing protein [Proteobacteria bacterium]|nr:PEP-CTERM sorting domain-containing protein [Pseudomonadota bacterium]
MKKTLIALVIAFGASVASAAPLVGYTVQASTGGGSLSGSLTLLSDGNLPTDGSAAASASNVYWNGTGKSFIFDFGAVFALTELQFSLDSNDDYSFVFKAEDGTALSTKSIARTADTRNGGMYSSLLQFDPIAARSVVLSATGGRNPYALGEIAFFGTLWTAPITSGGTMDQAPTVPTGPTPGAAQAVPEPGTLALLAGGLAIAGLRLRKRRG